MLGSSGRVRRTLPILVAGSMLAALAPAQGGPPLLTDDPGTPGAGLFEINVAATLDRDGERRLLEAPLLDLNYGIGERGQLKYEVPWTFLDEAGTDGRNGLGNSLIGFKWRFRDAVGESPALSIYPQIEFENPGSSSSERGLADEGTALILPAQAHWDLGVFGATGELGYELREEGDDGWLGGLAFAYPLSDRADLLAEIHFEAERSLEESEGVFNLGSRLELATGCALLASAGTGLWSADGDRTDFLAYLGVQFLR